MGGGVEWGGMGERRNGGEEGGKGWRGYKDFSLVFVY